MKKISKEECDLVFAMDGDSKFYILPMQILDGKRTISLKKYAEHEVKLPTSFLQANTMRVKNQNSSYTV